MPRLWRAAQEILATHANTHILLGTPHSTLLGHRLGGGPTGRWLPQGKGLALKSCPQSLARLWEGVSGTDSGLGGPSHLHVGLVCLPALELVAEQQGAELGGSGA